MKNIFIDTNILIYMDNKDVLSNTVIESIKHLLKNGKKYMFNIIGNDMKNEILKNKKYRKTLQKFASLYEVINNFRNNNNCLKITLWNDIEDNLIDRKIIQFVNTKFITTQSISFFKSDGSPNWPKINGDPHILVICNEFDCEYIISYDVLLCTQIINHYFSYFNKNIKLYDKTKLEEQNIKLCSELNVCCNINNLAVK